MRRYPGKLRWLVVLAALLTHSLAAAAGFVVRDIRVEGLDRIAPGTVFNSLPIEVGDEFNPQVSADAVRALFKTGYFDDIRLEQDGEVLVVIVQERESIAEINITGNEDVETADLVDGLKQIGFAVGEVFDEAKLDRVEQELQRQYYARGKYGVVIDSAVTPIDDNRVAVSLAITEGQPAKISEINVIGNEAFSDGEVLGVFSLSKPGLFSFLSNSDQYSKQRLSGDLEALRSFYLDNGYINFAVDSTQVSITPDRREVYVTVNINEGEQFRVSEVKLAGELIVQEEDLFDAVIIRRGDVFSRKSISETTKNLTDRLGEEGYAFANVNAVPDIDDDTDTVIVTFFVDPGKRVYVRRINFFGNTRTRDEVLRREMRQLEGSWISTVAVERSKVRLQRLGYFTDVNVETVPVPGTPDQVDINFTVAERPSGNLLLGLGFSQQQGIIFNTSVAQENFLGSGKSVEFAFNNSEVNRQFVIGLRNPYYTVDGISRGFRVAWQETDAANANITRFDSRVASVGVNFGIPVSEYNFVNFAFDYEDTELRVVDPNVSPTVTEFLADEGENFSQLRLTSSFSYDTRNDAIFPSRGALNRIRSEVAIPGGDLRYYKGELDTRWFFPLARDFTLLMKGRVGYGNGYGSTESLPFFENFFAGGPRSVRGYEENTLGPQDSVGRALGGNLLVVGNAELILPIPFLEALKSVRVTSFFDAGNVYAEDDDFTTELLRYSAGVSGVWLSPFGVLSVSVAQPFNDQPNDELQPFQFTFGTSF